MSLRQFVGAEVKVVGPEGNVRTDGKILDWTGDGLLFEGRESPVAVNEGELVVTQVPDTTEWREGDTLLVVNGWGCGGTMMYTGVLGEKLLGEEFCFKKKGSEFYEATALDPNRVYKVLSADQFSQN